MQTRPELGADLVGTDPNPAPLTLSAAGTTVVVDVADGLPRVLYWGPRIPETDGSLAEAEDAFLRSLRSGQSAADGLSGSKRTPAVLPEQSSGWMGTPGLDGHRGGRHFSAKFTAASWRSSTVEEGTQRLQTVADDLESSLRVRINFELAPSGVLKVRAGIENTGPGPFTVNSVRIALPVPVEATEVLDFVGRHLRERTPQRLPFPVGTHLREGRRGRTGSDAAFVLAAGSAGFGFRAGEVWAVHTAWSGNHATYAEQALTGVKVIGGGEVLLPGEVILTEGQSYTTPWVYASYGRGLDEVSAAFHDLVRVRPSHPRSPRPVVVNTWEAVYFGHELEGLVELAGLGAKVGAERFVLDDGWFLGRHHERAGLGDWVVDVETWPQGLGPLADEVRRLGMDFGLWFEPEMVNEDSELARAHPDWILSPGRRLPLPGRHQQVLNLSLPEAYAHVLEQMSAVISEYDVAYVKWDHNRDLLEPGDRVTGQARVHEQTKAVYRLMDELKRRHPGLEIESCSSGGGRIDLEVLERTDRVWASDCIDPLERQQIQRWTGLLLPPELIGSHVGAPEAHTTHRTHSLSFRCATALFAHFGIEWDLRTASAEDLTELAEWVALYKAERTLIHSGRVVRTDYPDSSYWCHGVVSPDRRRALFALVALDTSTAAQPGQVRLPGLDPALGYRVEPIGLSAGALVQTRSGAPEWLAGETLVSGALLGTVGLQGPMLYPEQALVFRLTVDG
jgi:alpha-galactosidase